jgi:A/G-specific adenine glycosylase
MINNNISDRNHIFPLEQSKLLEFQQQLLSWYKKNGRSFPWRKKSTSKYRIIISELLLQRTRAETVAKIFDIFINKYPSWQDLARATEAEIGDMIQSIGLWRRRATTLKQLSLEMVRRKGKLPKTREEILALPGVGQYIANSIILLCHRNPQPLLDVNMARVLERVFGPRELADIRYDPYLQSLSLAVVQCENANKINWAIIDLAATVCLIRNPRCCDCPLRFICDFTISSLKH